VQNKLKINTISCALPILLIFFFTNALAEQPIVLKNSNVDILSMYQEATSDFRSKVKDAAIILLLSLLGLQFLVNGTKKILRPQELEGIVAPFVMSLISATFFIALIQSDWIFQSVLNGFISLGKTGTGLPELSPDTLLLQGITTAGDVYDAFSAVTSGGSSGLLAMLKDPGTAIFILVIQFIIIASFAVMAAQLVLAMIGGYFWMGIVPVLLGFGGLSYTRDMAITSLKGGIAIGVKIMTIYIVAGVSGRLAIKFGTYLGQYSAQPGVSIPGINSGCWAIAFSCAILAYLSLQIPKLASDLLNGQSSLTAGDAASTVLMGGAAAAAGVAGVAGLATGTAAGLEGLRKAVGAGMDHARDYGRSGPIGALSGLGTAGMHIGSNALNSAKDNFAGKVDNSFGGRAASSIEASRGGAMSQGVPDAGGSPGGSAAGTPGSTVGDAGSGGSSTPGGNINVSAPAGSSTGGAGGAGNSASGGSGITTPSTTAALDAAQHSAADATRSAPLGSGNSVSSLSGSTAPRSPASMGDASNASVNPTNAPQPRQTSSLAERAREWANLMPDDAHQVGVNANIGTHHEE